VCVLEIGEDAGIREFVRRPVLPKCNKSVRIETVRRASKSHIELIVIKDARHIATLAQVPPFAVVLASVTSFGLLVIHAPMMGWQLWLVAVLILLAWSPIFVRFTLALYRQYRWLALLFVLLVGQSVHFVEHVAQVIQVHLLGFDVSQAHGIIGQLDLEWTHFLFDAGWVPICVYTLLVIYRKSNPWLWALAVVAGWHAAEHVAIMRVYLGWGSWQNSFLWTGIVGSPGLLASGGAIGGGLPLSRPDLHSIYNAVEEMLILIAYLHQIDQLPGLSGGKELAIGVREETKKNLPQAGIVEGG
jgi:hypothetical protein